MRRPVVQFDASAAECEICSATMARMRLRLGGVVDRCPDCGHVQRDLIACPARHRSEAYGGDPSLDAARLWLTYRAVRGPGRPKRVFEIGFGAGALLRRFLDDDAEVSGVDAGQFETNVDAAVVDRGRLWWGAMEALEPGDLVVDLVYGVHVIEHVEDVEKLLLVAKRLLAPGGRLVLLTPAADSWGMRVFGSAWWLLEDPTHIRFFTARSLRHACENAGFRDISTRRLWADNLTMEVGSLARAARLAPNRPGGVLSSRAVMIVGVLSAPFVLLVRALLRLMRPTMMVEARLGV